MRIEELDEFQGVTPQVVSDWMTKNGWKETKPNWWARGEDGLMFDQQTFDQMWFWLKGLADVYTDGNQLAMLRKINPRLCPWPSKEAREEHRGPWLAVCTEDGTACMGRFRPDVAWFKHTGEHILTSEDSFVRFWPCDDNGNKVRWPTNAGREML